MALKGTLKDFGIADIFQLIGQQAKTGVLHLKNKNDEIHISFHEGSVVRADESGRKKRELLGKMLVRAELIVEAELEAALEEQKRTLKRLGDVLVDSRVISRSVMREMAQLQTTETLYKLFSWKNGTYEFEQGAVEWDRESLQPIRSESVLMEGFRMVDEWPMVRRKITSYGMTFEQLRSLAPAPSPPKRDDVDAAFAAFEERPADELPGDKAPKDGVGSNEQRVMGLVEGRTVEKIIDTSRLGEFETCKALLNLVNAGYLRPIPPASGQQGERLGGDFVRGLKENALAFVLRVGMTVAIVGILGALGYSLRLEDLALASGVSGTRLVDPAAQKLLAAPQLSRIRAALELYRIERGEYPKALAELPAEGLLSEEDLRYPWIEPYHYRRLPEAEGFVLFPPFH